VDPEGGDLEERQEVQASRGENASLNKKGKNMEQEWGGGGAESSE